MGLVHFYSVAFVLLVLSVTTAIETIKVTWQKEDVPNTPPAQEGASCDVVKIKGSPKLFLFGGRLGDLDWNPQLVYAFDPVSAKWSKQTLLGADNVAPRSQHSSVVFKDKIYIFGGRTGVFSFSNELFVVEPEKGTLRILHPKGVSPSPRERHGATVVGNKMIITGGNDLNETFADTAVYDIETNTWEVVSVQGTFGKRTAHKMVTYAKKVYVIGGLEKRDAFHTDVVVLDVDKMAWSLFPTQTLEPRAAFSATLLGEVLWIFGGYNVMDKLNDVQAWNMATNGWMDVHATSWVERRFGHCAAADPRNPSAILIFGGHSKYWVMLNEFLVLRTAPTPKEVAASFVSDKGEDMSQALINRALAPRATVSFDDLQAQRSKLSDLLVENTEKVDTEQLKQKLKLCKEMEPKAAILTETDVTLEKARKEVKELLAEVDKLLAQQSASSDTTGEKVTKLQDIQTKLRQLQQEYEEDEKRYRMHSARKAELRDSQKRFKEQVDIAVQSKKAKERDIDGLRDRLAGIQYQEETAKKEIEKLQREIALEREKEDTNAKILSNIKGDLQALNDTYNAKVAEHDGILANRSKLEEKIRLLEARLNDKESIRKMIVDAESSAREAERRSIQWFEVEDPSEAKINFQVTFDLDKKTKELQDKLALWKQQLSEMGPRFSASFQAAQKAKEDYDAKLQEEQSASFRKSDAENQRERKEIEVNRIKSQQGQNRQQAEKAKTDLETAEAVLKDLDDQVKRKEGLAADQAVRLAEEENAYATYADRHDANLKEIRKLQSALSKAEDELQEALNKRDDLVAQINALMSKISIVMGSHQHALELFKNSQIQGKDFLARLTVGNCQGEIVALKEAMEMQKQRLDETQNSLIRTRVEADGAKEEKGQAQAKLEAANARIDTLKQQVKDLQKQLQQLQQQQQAAAAQSKPKESAAPAGDSA